jgi:hypothetical protein
MDISPNERASWAAHYSTPVTFNPHAPLEIFDPTIKQIDLNPITSTRNALSRRERVLILTPLRDAASYLPTFFELLSQLSYPHHLIDLAFLVGDTADETLAIMALELHAIQNSTDIRMPFRSVTIVEKDFHVSLDQNDVQDRHSFAAQASRRKALGRARNYLLSAALRADHSWVYWRDVDIVDSPPSIIEDFVAHERDVLVPNIWFHRYREVDGKMVDIEGRCASIILP